MRDITRRDGILTTRKESDMAIGDGVRRDIALVSEDERNRFINAIVKLDTAKFFPDGVSYWDKQEEIHKNAHFHGVDVHFGPAFISWHRVIVNRLEQLLREVDPDLSLHYWDWTTDPRSTAGGRAALFTPQFMGNASGDAAHLLNDFESSEDVELGNGHNRIWRDVGATAAKPDGTPDIDADATILAGGDFASFGALLKNAHDFVAHSYIGGTISDAHYSFHDPFVFLLHSNLDRLWAKWQTELGHSARMISSTAYAGLSTTDITTLNTDQVEPWAGGTGLEPWASDPTKQAHITYTDISVVAPPCYDTNGSSFEVAEVENPFDAATNRYEINFNDVPETETTWRAAVLRVYSCDTFTIKVRDDAVPAAPFSVVASPVVTHHTPAPYADVRIWFEFTAGALGTAPQMIAPVNTTIECVESGEQFLFELKANTIHRPTVAVELALDQSGSMSDPAGTSGATRLQVLKDAASLFASLIQKDNGIGIIRFDDDAYPPGDPTYGGMAITKVLSNSFGDATRVTANTTIAAHGAHGNTSVGDGLEMARNQLNALPAGSYNQKAILLLTDGLENTPKMISEVAGLIDDRTFAVGLGNETQVNTLALSTLSGGTGGYLLLSGLLSSSLDDQFRLRKFFLQILASVTKTSIVSDPLGYVGVGTRVRIPFVLCEADIDCRVILLTDFPVVRLSVETPDGQLIDETNAATFGVAFDTGDRIKRSMFDLPLAFQANKIHAGTWHAVLEVDEDAYRKALAGSFDKRDAQRDTSDLRSKGAKYCLSVHSFSNLRMNATVEQDGFTPGSTLSLRASLTEYNLPVERRASVRAELEYPDHTRTVLTLTESEPGIFHASLAASASGIYRFNIIAEGGTYRGAPFTREQLLTAAVSHGIRQPQGPDDGGRDGTSVAASEKCCKTMTIFVWIIIFLLLVIIVLLWRLK
jgi:hypothetical protein